MPKITPFSLEEKIESFIRRYQLVKPGEKILVAVSGGPDSMCLMTVLSRLGYPIHVAHFNYLLRQEESIDDELFVQDWCVQHEIPCDIKRIDTEVQLVPPGKSVQEVARNLRYAWFDALVVDYAIDYVATGHHESDQAETVVFNLIRSSGLTGAQGILATRSRNGHHLIRPLLKTSKAQIMAYLSALNIPFRIDRTNLKSDYSRNKIRHAIMPQLEMIKPGAVRHLSQFARRMQDIMPLFQSWIIQLKNDFCTDHSVWTEIRYSPEWHSGVMYLLLEEYGFTSSQTHQITEHLRDLAKGKTFYSLDYMLVTAHQSVQVAKRRDIDPILVEIEQPPYEYRYADKIYKFYKSNLPPDLSTSCLSIDYAKISWPITLRTWQSGDKMLPLGMHGKTKKIKDMLTDKQITGIEKRTALVLQSEGQIICLLSSLHASELTKPDSTTKEFLTITMDSTR